MGSIAFMGISGRMITALQPLYANCSVSIKVRGRVSMTLLSHTGLKQGCPLSPILFGLFTDGLHRHLMHECADVGPQLRCGRYVPDLGYANDFSLLATTPLGLQRSIDAVFELCRFIGMIVSTSKTKVMVVSPHMHMGGPYQWSCGGILLHWVGQYKYLGVMFM